MVLPVDDFTLVWFSDFIGLQTVLSSAKILEAINRVRWSFASLQRFMDTKASSKPAISQQQNLILNRRGFPGKTNINSLSCTREVEAELPSVLTMGNWHISSFKGSWPGRIMYSVSAAIQINLVPLTAASALARCQCWAAPCTTQLHKSLLFSDKALGVFVKIGKKPHHIQTTPPPSLLASLPAKKSMIHGLW